MLSATSGVSGAFGKGFDDFASAQKWVDDLVLARHPGRIALLRAEVDELVQEVAGARSRM